MKKSCKAESGNHRIETDRFESFPAEKKRILHERAKALARIETSVEEYEDTLDVVEFFLANERYAIEMKHVREVYPLKDFAPLPCTPSFVLGIMNFRGQILSIIDLKKIFELNGSKISNINRIIILYSSVMEFGILADRIIGVNTVPVRMIQPSLPTLTGLRAKYLKGVTSDRMIILDGEKILGDDKIIVEQEVME